MPGKKKYVSKKPKTLVKKVAFRKKKTGNLSGPMKAFSQIIPYPREWKCKFRYIDDKTLVSGSGGSFGSSFKFRLNSLFDPNETNTGHQPYGYDQMTALYSRYQVFGCLVEITFTDPSNDGMVCGCLVQSSSGIGGITGIMPGVIKEQPYSWTKPCNNTGSQVVVFKQYFPIASVEGLSKIQYECGITDFSAQYNQNPTLMPTIQVAVANDSFNSGYTITARIQLTYFAKLYSPILQAQS